MNKFYKLNVSFKPWWCEHFLDVYPSKHVETILKEEYSEDYYEEDVDLQLWKEIKNLQFVKGSVYLESYDSNIPIYLKYLTENKVFYFYLYTKTKIILTDKKGKSIYRAVYFLDTYMTIFYDKLQILLNKNPKVKFNYKYCIPWRKIDNNICEINIVKQKELSNYINDLNVELVRKKIFSITEDDLYNQISGSIIPDDKLWLKEASNTGRYRYIILQSSALSIVNNNKITPIKVKQTIIVVPLVNDDILNKISNIDLTQSSNKKLIIGNNFIGTFECDIPYSYLYGLYTKSEGKIIFDKDQDDVWYFEIPINYYNKEILIDYRKYEYGFYGKLNYFFYNIDTKIIPETEIALLTPQYYREVYDNGSGSISNDLSKFFFQWNKNQVFTFNLYLTIQFNNELTIAYNYGDNTNISLSSYDNTNVEISNLSIPIGLIGSAATQYYSNNINTSLTSIQNRKLDQEQARRNRDFDSGKEWNTTLFGMASRSIRASYEGNPLIPWSTVAGSYAAAIDNVRDFINTSINTAQRNNNYIDDQIRANRNLASQINNIYSAPNISLSNPFVKGVIPNNGELFIHYAYELHPYDKKLIFAKLLDEGYIYNYVDNLNSFKVRKYMNILNINPYMHYSHLLGILKNNDKSYFNSQKDYDDFFIWLAKPKKIYNTNTLINVLDWEENDYINNTFVEKVMKPKTETEKININTYQWINPRYFPNYNYDQEYWYSIIKNILIEKNTHIPNDVWQDIDISVKDNNILIKVINYSSNYEGEILLENCIFWKIKAYFQNSDKIRYFEEYLPTVLSTYKEIYFKQIDVIQWDIEKHSINSDLYIYKIPLQDTEGSTPNVTYKIKKINFINFDKFKQYIDGDRDAIIVDLPAIIIPYNKYGEGEERYILLTIMDNNIVRITNTTESETEWKVKVKDTFYFIDGIDFMIWYVE